jgi:hypothetical protein
MIYANANFVILLRMKKYGLSNGFIIETLPSLH